MYKVWKGITWILPVGILQRTSSATNAGVGSDYNILSKGRDKGEFRGMKDDFITLLTPVL